MRTIKVSQDVWEALQKQARPFEDTPNDVLRKVLGITPTREDRDPMSQPSSVGGQHKFSPPVTNVVPGDQAQADKFDDQDRVYLVRGLEKLFKVRLQKESPGRKFYKDQKGEYYAVFGGTGNWHGINPPLQKQIARFSGRMHLVMGKKLGNKIEIYTAEPGQASKFASGLGGLSSDKNGQLKFTFSEDKDRLVVNEIANLSLSHRGDIDIHE